MNTKEHRNLGATVDVLASALLQSGLQAVRRIIGSTIATRPGETQAEAQHRAAAVRAKQTLSRRGEQ